MRIVLTLQLPDDLAQHADPAREALDSLVIECHRSETLSSRQCRELLGLGRIAFEGFLKDHHVEEGAYDVADLKRDIEAIKRYEELRSVRQ